MQPARISKLMLNLAMAGVVAVCLWGCSRQVATLDDRDFRDPMIRKAQARITQGDKDGAIDCLKKALERKPELAQADLELALLYDDYKKDYIKAIYHYDRYLELRPKTQKRHLIEDLIRKANMSYAAVVSDQFPDPAKKTQALEEENARLKASLREVRENLAKSLRNTAARQAGQIHASPAPVSPSVATKPSGLPPDASQNLSAVSTATVYCVQAGDTLSIIASRVYNDPRKWNLIAEANKTNLVSPERMKAGQILAIPR